MRPWNVALSLAMAGLGLVVWRLADLIPPQECPPADGTCAALEEMAYRLFALVTAAASVPALFLRVRRRGESTPERPLSPFEEGRAGDEPDVLFD